jgi:hypothetical protein
MGSRLFISVQIARLSLFISVKSMHLLMNAWRTHPEGRIKVVHVLNRTPCHEDVFGEWRCSSNSVLTSAADGSEEFKNVS